MTEKEIKLQSKNIELTISPKEGACIKTFKYKKSNEEEIDVLAPSDNIKETETKEPLGSFLLVPYAGEIKEAAFIYWGIKRKIIDARTENPENGDGWQKEWDIITRSDNELVLEYKHDGLRGFPYPYTVRQTIEVQADKVNIEVKITNNFELPMPFGLGYKPYFRKTEDMEIGCRNKTVWSHEGLLSISKPYRTPQDWDFERTKPLNDTEFDTCFGGFDGKIEVKYPLEKIKINLISGADFNHLFINNKKENNYINIITSTNAQDAFNVAAKGIIGSGIKTLEPDESNTDTFEFIISEE